LPYIAFGFGSIAFLSYSLFWYNKQKAPNTIGGAISSPKFIWLVLCMYSYYFFTPLVYYTSPGGFLPNAIFCLILFLLVRAIVQGYLMYYSRNWSAKWGVVFNIGGIFLISICIFLYPELWWNQLKSSVPAAILLLQLGLLFTTDAYYAYAFHKLVGSDTMGDRAIWFACHDPQFKSLNRTTALLNLLHITLFLYLMTSWIFYV
jgi:hypothetical protein